MVYVFDIDGTICTKTVNFDYDRSEPIIERINKINQLYKDGEIIILLTARGMGRFNNDAEKAKEKFYDMTATQLKKWGVKYHQLFLGKPAGDVYVDDKAIKDVNFFKDRDTPRFLPRTTNIEMNHVEKGWGWERWICNGPEYCGKLLFFKKGKRCSWHKHRLKDEVFYLQSGKMIVYYSDDDDITKGKQIILNPGDNFHVYRGLRHQMVALEDSELFEFSTTHFDTDSYRIIRGD